MIYVHLFDFQIVLFIVAQAYDLFSSPVKQS
jgi:hypothetical protein